MGRTRTKWVEFWYTKKRTKMTKDDIEECKQDFEAFRTAKPSLFYIDDCNQMLDGSWNKQEGMHRIFYDSRRFFRKCVRWIEILPERKREIIVTFTKHFNQIRKKVHKMEWLAVELPLLLNIEEITKAPYEVVKSFFQMFPPEGIRWTDDYERVELKFESQIEPFLSHPNLHEYLRVYYKIDFYYILSYFHSGPFIESIVKTGVRVLRPSRMTAVPYDLELFYYLPKVHPLEVQLDEKPSIPPMKIIEQLQVSEDILCKYSDARQKIADCISSTYYGQKLGSIVEQELLSFVYDVALSLNVEGCKDRKEYLLSNLAQPENVVRRSSRVRNINRNNFYNRKRKRKEHPFFGVGFYRKKTKRRYRDIKFY